MKPSRTDTARGARLLRAVCCASLMLAALAPGAAPPELPALLTAPPQDQGLPYTRSGAREALSAIRDRIAVFAGSRYAYVYGLRTTIDDVDPRHIEALGRDGTVFVPEAFGSLLAAPRPAPPAPPAYLAERWVYELPRAPRQWPATVRVIEIEGRRWIDFAAAAANLGLSAHVDAHGLVLVGVGAKTLPAAGSPRYDAIITLFDTPEKIADPDIATHFIPTLARQGRWTDHARATQAQLATLAGPATVWPTAPAADYNLTGFDARLLGSPPPPPGMYPRVLFNRADVPAMAARITATKGGQQALIEMEALFRRSWWDPATSDGAVFAKLVAGDLAGLEWDIAPGTVPALCPQQFKGQKPGIANSHVAYVPECLTTMALWCLLVGDDARGRQVASAITNYFKLREPLLDELLAISDSEFGSSWTRADGDVVRMDGNASTVHWRTVHGAVAHMNLGLALDFAGAWMDAGQKDLMRRIIAKATYGRRPYGQDGPVRFRDVNWVTWDLPHLLALTAIEGLEGFDREGYESDRETVRAFCDWGIDPDGVVYESNGKTPGGFQFQLLSMVALARRGENLFGHPHWRQLLKGQLQMTSPSGRVVVNSGTQYVPFSRSVLSPQLVEELKAFYPGERCADYMLGQLAAHNDPASEGTRAWSLAGFDATAYCGAVGRVPRLRLPSPTYPGFVRGVLYAADWDPAITRTELGLPLDLSAPVHGVFSSRSNATPDAAWMCMLVRPDHYLGAGHHHADAGMFHFSAGGVDWFTESPFSQSYDGRFHNQVLVDGHAEPEGISRLLGTGYQAAGRYLGATCGDGGSFASADLTASYSWRWMSQPPQVWAPEERALPWEMDPSPDIARAFAGTARMRMRPWWPNSNFGNFIPTLRAPWNPMQRVFRSVGLVRGAHAYGVIIDDLAKDGVEHDYLWTGMLNGGVWRAEVPGLPAGWAALAAGAVEGPVPGKGALAPHNGEALLLVVPLAGPGAGPAPSAVVESARDGAPDRAGAAQVYDRLAIADHGVTAAFRVLLLPARAGVALPRVDRDSDSGAVTVNWPDQQDRLTFTGGVDGRTLCVVERNGQRVAATP